MAQAYPGGQNTWVPSYEASGQLISYLRDPKNFKINDYVCHRPATKPIGLYLRLDVDAPARVVSEDEYAWPDGAERPQGDNNTLPFDWDSYICKRTDIPVRLGDIAIANADWPILATNSQMAMQQRMTLRTQKIVNVLEATSSWPSTNYGTAQSLNLATGGGTAGQWDKTSATEGNANYLNIRKSLFAALLKIQLGTNSLVKIENLQLVIGPELAAIIAQSPEIAEFLKQSPFAMAQVRGDAPNANLLFGLPEKLYGFKLVIEDAAVVTSRKGAATVARSWVKSRTSAVITMNQGGDTVQGDSVGDKPTMNFSTIQVFHYGGLATVKQWADVRNERTETHVVEQIDVKMVAPITGFLITSCAS